MQQLQRAVELTFRFNGNKSQFEFNAGLLEKLEGAISLLEEGETVNASSAMTEAIKSLNKRNKLNRIADKSDAG